MASSHEALPLGNAGWRKLAALALIVAGIGLPINQLAAYALVLAAAVVIFSGELSARATMTIAFQRQ